MDNTPRKSKSGHSMDGMVGPRGQLARAKFAQPRTKLDTRLHGVRMRRPGFHKQAAASLPAPQSAKPVSTPTVQPSFASKRPKFEPERAAKSPARKRFRLFSKRQRKAGKPHSRTKTIARRSGLVVGVLVLVTAGWLGWKVLHATGKVFGSDSNLLGFLNSAPLKCEGAGRCNILLAGNSADDPGHDGANLTDSIMIVSIDMKNKTAFMLSVPRDFYVNIPGNGYAKINEAYPDGQAQSFSQAGYANGGMGLLEETVSQDFGIPISYYALVDYSALKDAVDTVGGIDVNIQSDNPHGLYDPSIDWSTHGPLVKLSNGVHTLTGEQALDLARARGDAYGSYGFAGSDFTRTQNQRLMMLALKSKIMSSSTLANPIKLGQLFDTIGNNLHTDLTTGNIRRLYDVSKGIPNSDIKSYGLNNITLSGQQNVNLLSNYATPRGQSALIPSAGVGNYTQIQLYLKQLTSSDPVVREAANVVVLNGSGTTGLASAESKVLTSKGMYVSATGDAPSTQPSNTVIDNSQGKAPATLAELKSQFGVSTATTNTALVSAHPNATFIVILGTSQQMPASTSTNTSQ